MGPAAIIPVAVLSFLGGAAFGKGRRPLSMLPPGETSPLPGVPRGAWLRFVRVSVVGPAGSRSPRGRLGLFGLTPRHLCDVGLMTSARKSSVGGEAGVWTGEWRAPLTEEKFLASRPVQYRAFTASTRKTLPAASPHVGKKVDGEVATLSGLLAVAHSAGTRGVAGWVADPSVRAKFPATTRAFKKANQIF